MIVDFWKEINEVVQNEILTPKREDFLQHPAILETAFTTGADGRTAKQIDYIVEHFGLERTLEILNGESLFGHPSIYRDDHGVNCSPNRIQMLYHLVYWSRQTGVPLDSITHILEWGAGYGSMAYVYHSVNSKALYTMVDTPVFSELQNWYIKSVGMRWPFHSFAVDKAVTQKILELDKVDLFISTWGLSESGTEAITFAAQQPAIRTAKHVLLAFQATQEEFSSAGEVVDILNEYRETKIERIESVPYMTTGANWYATC